MDTGGRLWFGLKQLVNELGVGVPASNLYHRLKYELSGPLKERNRNWYKQGAPDGLPLPPPYSIYQILSQFDAELFWTQSVIGAAWIRRVLNLQGCDIKDFRAILDFGCGCGRIIRQWNGLTNVERHGTDCNKALIHWCQRSLPFAQFCINRLDAPLTYADKSFDLIYAISVFTHLDQDGQAFWFGEMARVLQPGGIFLLTVHGESRLHELSESEQNTFKSGKLTVVRGRYAGSNYCSTYHPKSYFESSPPTGFQFVSRLPDAAEDVRQDVVVLKRI